jgi:hypothetical protein
MPLDLKPYTWNWASIATGNTYPASQFVETPSDYPNTLERVLVKIKDSDGNTFRELDSANGDVVINVATAGNWDFTIGSLRAPLTAGIYSVEVDAFDSTNIEATFTRGTWEIL